MRIRRVRVPVSRTPYIGWLSAHVVLSALVVIFANVGEALVLLDSWVTCDCWPRVLNSHFSPVAVAPRADSARASERSWCFWSVALASMDEAPLDSVGADEAYRLLLLPSFGDGSFVVRIERRGDRATLTAKRYRGRDWPARSAEPEMVERVLDLRDLQRVRGALHAAEFWDQHPDPIRRGHDGSEWILEGWRPGGHRARWIWSPDPADPQQRAFRDAGQVIAELASFSIGYGD